MSEELITTIRAFGTVLSLMGVTAALLTQEVTISLVLMVVGVSLFALTLGENK